MMCVIPLLFGRGTEAVVALAGPFKPCQGGPFLGQVRSSCAGTDWVRASADSSCTWAHTGAEAACISEAWAASDRTRTSAGVAFVKEVVAGVASAAS